MPAEPPDERFKELVGTIDAIVTEYDRRSNRFTYISEQAERILGYPPSSSRTPCSHMSTKRIERGSRLSQRGGPGAQRVRVRAPDPVRPTAALSGFVSAPRSCSTSTASPAPIRGVWLDVTALKRAEAEREQPYLLLQATLDATADAILSSTWKATSPPTTARSALGRSRKRCSTPATMLAALGSVVDRLVEPDEFIRRVTEIYEYPEKRDARRLLARLWLDRRARLGAATAGRCGRRPRVVLPRHHREACCTRGAEHPRGAVPLADRKRVRRGHDALRPRHEPLREPVCRARARLPARGASGHEDLFAAAPRRPRAREADVRCDARGRGTYADRGQASPAATATGARSRRSGGGAPRTTSGSSSSTTGMSPIASISRSSSGTRRRWRRSAGSPAVSRTTSTTC